MAPKLFKVIGLQRTGTNLAQHLVETNFNATCLDEVRTGWKHGPLRLKDGKLGAAPVYFVLCVKNPYAWALSCYRFFQRSVGGDPTMAQQFVADPSMSFETFLTSPHYAFESPIHRWNVMHQLWLGTLPMDRTLIVRQEDQLEDQVRFLTAVESTFGFTRKGEFFAPTTRRVDVDRAVLGRMNINFYRSQDFLLEYSAEMKRFVVNVLDSRLMQQFHYITD